MRWTRRFCRRFKGLGDRGENRTEISRQSSLSKGLRVSSLAVEAWDAVSVEDVSREVAEVWTVDARDVSSEVVVVGTVFPSGLGLRQRGRPIVESK